MIAFLPAIGAMLAGAAVSAYGQNQALKKQQQIALMSQQEQLRARDRATETAMRTAMDFDPDQRKERQDGIAQQLEAEFQPAVQGAPITAQGVQVGTTIPESAGTSDYLAATARERAKTTESLRSLAQLMGRIGSAGRLRQDEAVAISDTAGAIGRIQSGANNLAEIETIRANAVTPSLGSQLLGGALKAYGMNGLPTGAVGGSAGGTSRVVSTSYANPDLFDLTRGPWNR